MVRVRNVEENGDSRCQMVHSDDNIKLHSYRNGKHCSSCSCQKKYENETNQLCEESLNTITTNGETHGYDYITNNILLLSVKL